MHQSWSNQETFSLKIHGPYFTRMDAIGEKERRNNLLMDIKNNNVISVSFLILLALSQKLNL